MQFFKHSRKLNSKKVTGQGMSEYLIIVGLIAVAGIAAMGVLGNVAKNNVLAASEELSGGDGQATLTRNDDFQGAMDSQRTKNVSLNNFASHADLPASP